MADEALNLKKAMLAEYGSFSDRRIKDPKIGSHFTVDDRVESDIGADKKPYSYFCMMSANVVSADEVRLSMYGNIPMGPPVAAWSCESGIEISKSELTLAVTRANANLLLTLAKAFRAIVRRGAPRYDTPNYKYVCPRTADSLERLERTLKKAWDK